MPPDGAVGPGEHVQRLRRWVPFAATLVVVTALLLWPRPDRTAPGEGVEAIPGVFAHAAAYVALALTGGMATRAHHWLLLFVAAHAALTEYLQAFVPNRTPNPRDWLANMAGAVLGLGLVWLARRRRPAGE